MARNKNTYVDFTREPAVPLFSKAGAIATAVNDQEDYFRVGRQQAYFEVCQNLASTAIAAGFAPTASGWLIPCDAAAEGSEYTQGILSGPAVSFTTGTDPAFFIRATFKSTTIANTTCCFIGFRKLGAYEAAFSNLATTITAYDEAVMLGVEDTSGTLSANTSLATVDARVAATHAVIAASTWYQLEIKVSAAGVATYRIGSSLVSQAAAEAALAADATLVAKTLTSAIEFVPFIAHAGVTGVSDLRILKYECGYQES